MKNILTFKNIFSVIDDYDVFLFDLWGVVVEGDMAYPFVADAINKIIELKKVFFVSNAPKTIGYSFEKISSLGINATPDMFITSGEIARNLIKNCEDTLNLPADSKIYHLGEDRNTDLLSDINIATTDNINEADILLLSIYRDQGENLNEFDDLFKAAAAKNTVNICANPDSLIVNHDFTRYCAGYFAQKLELLDQKVIYTGKPFPEIFNSALSKVAGTPKERILMIGDTFETDILGANKIGIDCALTFTGNAKKFHHHHYLLQDKLDSLKQAAEESKAYPTFIIDIAKDDSI